MPCQVKCSVCGQVIYEWAEMPPNYCTPSHKKTWYERLYEEFKGKCQLCGHKLPTPREYAGKMRVEVFAVEPAKT